jgi:hypothetical protein
MCFLCLGKRALQHPAASQRRFLLELTEILKAVHESMKGEFISLYDFSVQLVTTNLNIITWGNIYDLVVDNTGWGQMSTRNRRVTV